MAVTSKTAAAATAIAELLELEFGCIVKRIGRADPDEVVYHLASGDRWSVSAAAGSCRIYKNWTSSSPEEVEVPRDSALAKMAAKYAATFAYA